MEKSYSKQIRNILAVIAVLLVIAALKLAGEVSVVLVLALFIFVLILPIAVGLEKTGLPAFLATLFSALLILVFLFLTVWFLLYSANTLVRTIPSYYGRINQLEALITSMIGRWVDLPEQFSIIDNLSIDWMGGVLVPALKSFSSSAIDIIGNVFVTFLLVLFLLIERHTLIPKIIQISRPDKQAKVSAVLDRIVKQVSKYLALKAVISLATGLLFYATAILARLDFAPMWGVMAFVLNFIPTFGSIIISVSMILMSVLQYAPDWTPVLITAAGAIGTQMILGNIIDPRLQGNNLNLSPFVILASLSIFGYIWGVVGMFLAVPLLSILEIIFANMDSTKGIAILLSSGSSFKRRMKYKEKEEKIDNPSLFSDVYMPGDEK
ncbi:MAG: AI-2E family transporter [Sphaerochaetaceae bacterium]|nr:AI-2E family transporter [Sphaerochaetaceae bacterium]